MTRTSSPETTRGFSAPSASEVPNPCQTQPQLRAFFDRLTAHPASALALDYDGTLAPFHIDRHAAVPWPGVREAVQKILEGGQTRVVLITGRQAEEVRDLLGVTPPPEIWGVHGRQRLFPDGHTRVVPLRQSEEQGLAEATAWLQSRDYLRFAESKSGSIAVHWRGLPAEQLAILGPAVHAAFTPVAERSGMSLLEFDGGVELRPLEPNKGSAVRTFLAELRPGTPFAFLGDDTTDEDAFLALRDTDALTVLVRSDWRPTNAQLWIRPPEQLLSFLEEWASRCGGAA
ncbi:MAG TPA: trehalose-phosphatase [Acidobacteriaceae bacterium]|jgi:trehalose-phosphatase|nr:trehalose-phosphatase [Acidobacteriaceae bacterium]